MRSSIVALAVVAAVAWSHPAEVKYRPPKLVGQVVDTSNTLGETNRKEIDRDLESFRSTYGFPIVVYVTGSLQGESIEDAAYVTFNEWKIGEAGKDNGVLLMIAPIERKLRIETGKGVGGAITDLQANDTLAKMRPYMQKLDLRGAIERGVHEIESMLRKEAGPSKPIDTAKSRQAYHRVMLILLISIGGLAVVLVILSILFQGVRRNILGVLSAIWSAIQAITAIGSLFGGKKDKKYSGGDGQSGGGGSSDGY